MTRYWNPTPYADAVEMTGEQRDPVLDVLVSAPFRILRAAGRVFRDQAQAAGGRPPARKVVNVSSIEAWGSPTPLPWNGPAATSTPTRSLPDSPVPG
jgi:NAD(P)-dependent dehydrogenase (short-subunit alcohol dehydrogenase family)